jgi:MFS family permease
MISDNSQQKEKGLSATLATPWHRGVNSYQWLILVIASAGWVFDVYEGQIFNITRVQLLQSMLLSRDPHEVARWGDIFLGIFLLGGAVGGLLFGSIADRWGRKPTLVATILVYSVFSGLTYFAGDLWQVGLLRFLVALGTGGEWSVAASLVAEVFPANARANAAGIFHATSVLGTWMATLTGMAVQAQWRYAYLVGIIPALLVAWVMISVKEPQTWKQAEAKARQQPGQKPGSVTELLSDQRWRKRAILGMLLAAVGLGSYWAVHVAGQDLAQYILVKNGVARAMAVEKAKPAYGFVETLGGLAGLFSFGPLCARLGRKRAFVWTQLAAFVIVPITCYVPQTYGQLLCMLPVFGFLTLCMHAGYAIYFPELFPTHLRATGAGFCFNVGRAVAASVLVFSGWLKTQMDLRLALSLLGCLFLFGLVVIHFLPETKGQALPQ